MPIRREKYTLSNDNIDVISSFAMGELGKYRIAKENLIKTRFSLEEALLRMQEHFGPEADVEVSVGRRLNRQVIEVRHRGHAYNPFSFSESVYDEWNQLLSYADYQPDYTYHNGVSLIRWSIPVTKHHPAVYFLIAIAAGLVLGAAGRLLHADKGALMPLLEAIEEVWIRLLNVISGPVIFLLIITTVLNMETISRQGGSASRLVLRVFRIGFISSLMAIATSIIVFPEITVRGLQNAASDLIFLLLQLIPEDVLEPFAEANSPQLLLMAFILGSALISSGKRANGITNLVREANSIGLLITGWMGSAAPFFIVALLAYEIIRGQTEIYTKMWIPLLIFLLVSTLFLLLYTLYAAKRENVRPGILISKLKGPFIRTIREGSADAVYDETLINCHARLGIDKQYAESGLLIGLILYMPVTVIGSLVFTMYAAWINNVTVTVTWCFIAAVTAIAMSIATPPVTGVAILTYVVMFSQLGIPSGALIAAMLFDILTGVLMTAENQYVLQLEMILESDRMAMLDNSILEREL